VIIAETNTCGKASDPSWAATSVRSTPSCELRQECDAMSADVVGRGVSRSAPVPSIARFERSSAQYEVLRPPPAEVAEPGIIGHA